MAGSKGGPLKGENRENATSRERNAQRNSGVHEDARRRRSEIMHFLLNGGGRKAAREKIKPGSGGGKKLSLTGVPMDKGGKSKNPRNSRQKKTEGEGFFSKRMVSAYNTLKTK